MWMRPLGVVHWNIGLCELCVRFRVVTQHIKIFAEYNYIGLLNTQYRDYARIHSAQVT